MTGQADMVIAIAGTGFAGLAIATIATLRAWNQWLELRRLAILRGAGRGAGGTSEIAELRKRVRKLEAIASGIEL